MGRDDKMSKKSDKSFAEFVLKGISYDKESDFFIINPSWLEIILKVEEKGRDIWKLRKDLLSENE